MSPIFRMKILIALVMPFLVGCSTWNQSPDWKESPKWMDSYRTCPDSGQAYYRGIPLASHNEHVQAELFTAINPANGMIYVVRSDTAGSKSAHAKAFLYHPEAAPPALPADYWPWLGLNSLSYPCWSERHMQETSQELRKAEIFSPDVYAAWELAPGSYVLDASLHIVQPFARTVITCAAGRTTFWAVAATSFLSSKATLHELNEADGKALVLHRLRSAGMQSGGPLSKGWVGQRECPME